MFDSVLTNLLLNFFFIIIGLLFFALYFDIKKKVPSRSLVIIISSLTILFCVIFSSKLDSGVYVDLRRIPFFLASLYFGPRVSFILLMIIIMLRLAIIGDGFIILVILNYVSTFLILAVLYKGFLKAEKKVKLMYSVGICLLMTLYNVLFGYMSGAEITFYEYVCIVLIPLGATILSVLTVEILRKLMTMRRLSTQNEKLQVVGQLAASISHEVRNPLTSSKGFLQLMKNEKDQDTQQRFLDLSLKGIDQANHVIEEYLTFTSSVPDRVEQIDVKGSIVELIELMEPLAFHHRVKIKTQLMDDMYVEGQARSFKQCVMNIMKNSIESMPAGGELNLTMTFKEKLVISISDTGFGMTDEQIHRFGEPFYTTKNEGTGLGIMAASIIVNSMKGKIQVKSELNRGTTVYLEFNEVNKELRKQ
ncbi:ATP-binding protein [Bacillus sp. Marseille-Q1617]|uniref:ATP-binding protein n=1 Tax=Bacillus sp. Marseille-Q1617 TaxID=2736887 RepID=UPI00158A21F7|nr:ATP-binding protein [Bacillus sp. Marseille-Q1617]